MSLLILVVDDEPDVEVLFRQRFRRDGRITNALKRGGAGLRKLYREPACTGLLSQVDDQLLKDIGVSSAGHRLRIRNAIALRNALTKIFRSPISVG